MGLMTMLCRIWGEQEQQQFPAQSRSVNVVNTSYGIYMIQKGLVFLPSEERRISLYWIRNGVVLESDVFPLKLKKI